MGKLPQVFEEESTGTFPNKKWYLACITPMSLQTSKDPEGGNMCHVLSQIKKES